MNTVLYANSKIFNKPAGLQSAKLTILVLGDTLVTVAGSRPERMTLLLHCVCKVL